MLPGKNPDAGDVSLKGLQHYFRPLDSQRLMRGHGTSNPYLTFCSCSYASAQAGRTDHDLVCVGFSSGPDTQVWFGQRRSDFSPSGGFEEAGPGAIWETSGFI
jgi:hypothetical protein